MIVVLIAAILMACVHSVFAASISTTPPDIVGTSSSDFRRSSVDSLQFKVVGGSPVVRAIPFMAQVFNIVAVNESLQCGGTLISPTQILTAAHCLYDVEKDRLTSRTSTTAKDGEIFYNTVVFVGGLISADAGEDSKRERYGVASIDCHAGFNMSTLENDICILTIADVCIHPPVNLNLRWNGDAASVNETVGTIATILGWGAINKQGEKSHILKSVDVPILDPAECYKLYVNFNSNVSICAGGEQGKDSCEGDSGGPLLTADMTQIGITSYGDACGKKGVPTVYTKISAFSDWILNRLQ